jgi:hypothetical protein
MLHDPVSGDKNLGERDRSITKTHDENEHGRMSVETLEAEQMLTPIASPAVLYNSDWHMVSLNVHYDGAQYLQIENTVGLYEAWWPGPVYGSFQHDAMKMELFRTYAVSGGGIDALNRTTFVRDWMLRAEQMHIFEVGPVTQLNMELQSHFDLVQVSGA